MNFYFHIPTSIKMERGISKKTGNFFNDLGYKKLFLVTDSGVRGAGILDDIEESLKNASISYQIFDDVVPNPTSENIMDGADRVKSFGADSILAVGGGSSIDTAKGISIMVHNEGDILDYEGVGKIKNPGLPLIVVPTTAGTGSEVTASTIVTNTETHFKTAIISPYIFPTYALLDAELTVKLPGNITAATGMDALTHAIESYTSKTTNPGSEAFSLQAIRMIGENIEKAYFVGNDMASRERMLAASLLAGAAFSQSRLGNVHAISHTLGGVFNIAHGIANAALLPFVMKFNLPACPEKMADIAKALGVKTDHLSVQEAAESAIVAVIHLNKQLNIPLNIKELGVDLNQLPKLVEDSMRSGNVLINPRLTTAQDIQNIIENAYNGRL